MVYGTYNELVGLWGESKPTYNWGAPHCINGVIQYNVNNWVIKMGLFQWSDDWDYSIEISYKTGYFTGMRNIV